MFISRSHYEDLVKRIERAEGKCGELNGKVKDIGKHVEAIDKRVGRKRSNIWDRYFMHSFFGGDDPSDTPDELTIVEEVQQIKNLLGIEEKVTTADRKLVIKPKTEKAPVKKTASKTPAAVKAMAKRKR